MNRRLRKHPQHAPAPEEQHAHAGAGRRFPFGLVWLGLTILVLVLVILYDRRGIKSAQEHIEAGKGLEQKGLYVEALNEYEEAFTNKRLGRKGKAQVATSMAEIYFSHLEDYPAAHRYYVQARQNYAASLNDKRLDEHARLAAERMKQVGTFTPKAARGATGVTTHTVIQRVELLNPPMADLKGPVVARYNGGEVHAGELLRSLAKRPEFLRPDFREDPAKLKTYLEGLLREDMAYQAAVSAGVHKDADVSERLFDYQKMLVTQRYQVDRQEQAKVVDNAEVEAYYKDNIAEFVQPGRITVSVVQADSETSAAELLQMLRDGQRFEDVATSYSRHKESAVKGGVLGELTEKDTTLAGIGEAPQVIEALFKLPVLTVTEVTSIGDAYYIFRISDMRPARNTTLEEARPKIENILRGRSVDRARTGLDEELRSAFDPQVDDQALLNFWNFVQAERDERTTGTSAATTATVTATTAGDVVTSGGAPAGR